MAKKPTKVVEPEELELEYGTPDWMEQREAELEEGMQNFDITKQIVIPLQWNGKYLFRILPVLRKDDWLMPVGYHWNIVTGNEDTAVQVGCPRFTYGQECPICDGIQKAIAEKKNVYADFAGQNGKGSIHVQRKYFLRVLLLSFDPSNAPANKSGKKPPKFEDLPEIKILELPFAVGKFLKERVADEDYGWDKLTHPTKGVVIRILKNDQEKDPKLIYQTFLMDNLAIPDDYLKFDTSGGTKRLVQPDDYPEMEDFIPKTTTGELVAMIEKHARDVHPVIASHVLSIDVGRGSQKQLASANVPEEPFRKSGASSKEELKALLMKKK